MCVAILPLKRYPQSSYQNSSQEKFHICREKICSLSEEKGAFSQQRIKSLGIGNMSVESVDMMINRKQKVAWRYTLNEYI